MADPEKNDQHIIQMLSNLHDELEKTRALDEKERAMMRHLMADIQETLKHSEAGLSAAPTLVDRLTLALDELEVTHPTLSAMIRKAIDTLNLAGI